MGCLNCACLREPLLASANSAVVTQVPAGIEVTEGDKSQGSHLEKAPAIIVIPPEESEEPEFSAEPAQATLQPQASIEAAFKIFLGANRYNLTRIDGATFVKGCRDCHLIGAHLSVTDADLLFARLAHGIGGKRGLDLHQFRAALDSIAMKKGTSTEELCIGIQSSGGPVSHGTTKAQTVRFHDDKSQYTGVHRHDGPDVGRKAGGHLPRFAHSDLRTPKAKDGGEGFGNTLAFPVDMDTAVSRATSLAADVAHNSFNSDASSIPPPTTFTLDHKGTDEDSDVSLTDVFQAYCAGKSDLDGRSFVKLLKDCNLFGSGFGQNDADLIFAKLSTQARRRISMEQFRMALQLIANKKKGDLKTVCSAVINSSGRKLVGTKAGNVRFHNDQESLLRKSEEGILSPRPHVPEFVQCRWGEIAQTQVPNPKDSMSFQSQRQTIRRRRASLPPKDSDKVTMVFTDVQGSTSLWEANPRAMDRALRIHDNLMRQNIAKYGGYEVTTEGDAFQVVFHDASDAVEFCLNVQSELCNRNWPEAILQHPDAMPSKNGVWRGLRVRMGLHSGRPEVNMHELTGRLRYAGHSVAIAKAIEDTCHGGQIVLSAQSFAQIDGILQHLQSPQVVDLGHHILHAHGHREPISMHLLQLVPSHLAYDYFACDSSDQAVSEIGGRLFPPILSKGQTSPGFHEAPSGSSVTLCFVLTEGAAAKDSITIEALASLRACVRDLLRKDGKSGYECQENEGAFMLAFNTLEHAAAFGVALQKALPRIPWRPELRAIWPDGLRVAVGACSGKYRERGPQACTGRADYLGTMLNRTAARIAAACSAGQVLLGVEDVSSSSVGHEHMSEVPMLGGSDVERLGSYKMKGVDTPIALYEVKTASEDGVYPKFPEPKTKGRVSD
mmetsp:Transcript_145750/g.265475  ORF Transcript_145750/g.265475 Transcript_145750/m.265475 type:complete len:893 (-) Transcript_145750:266-2944(-)